MSEYMKHIQGVAIYRPHKKTEGAEVLVLSIGEKEASIQFPSGDIRRVSLKYLTMKE